MTTCAESTPWLVADIGGTNARFGLVAAADDPVQHVRTMRCADYAGPSDAIRAYLAAVRPAVAPRVIALALATAIHGDTARMTNSDWTVSAAALAAAFGTDVLLLNDFEALARALPALRDDDLQPLGGGAPDARLPMAVIGPGTGLGVAACVPAGDGWAALATEGGHATLAAGNDFEDELLRVTRRTHPHVSAERLLSGLGLPLLYRAVATVTGAAAEPSYGAADITRHALAGTDATCTRTIDTFCALLGSFAGNVALTLGARGGVLVAGGVAEQLADLLPRSAFRARFEDKGRFRDYLAPVATRLIVGPHAALRGAALTVADRNRARPAGG